METRILAGILLRNEDGRFCLETLMENRYDLVLPQIITLTSTDEKLATDELSDKHAGLSVIARCFV